MALEEYRGKRDFSKTSEPEAKKTQRAGDLKFVIQKHSARRLHYDFRLEAGGVLLSWAVPKGPALDQSRKRLAVQTEDHPFDYRSFEGVIPQGEYGAGPVIVWDEGTYAPEEHGQPCFGDRAAAEKLIREGMKKGKISFVLKGKRLQGSWTLFRLSNKRKDWILLKHKDGDLKRSYDAAQETTSVISGRTIEEVRGGLPAARNSLNPAEIEGAVKRKMPAALDPMLASLVDGPFDEPDWIYEPKLDGIRAIAIINNGAVQLQSRRGLRLTDRYPEIVEALSKYDHNMILDGEIVALSQKGVPSFQALQQRSGLSNATDVRAARRHNPVFYYVFDIVHCDDYSLFDVTLANRKAILAEKLRRDTHVRMVDKLPASGYDAYNASVGVGLEGIVGKRLSSTYQRGRRSKDWLKVKAVLTSDFVIAGYTQATGSRATTFGSLILGYYDKQGTLVYAGGCGTGFNERNLQDLRRRFSQLKQSSNPFGKKILQKQITWLQPKLVAEIRFAEWTQDSILRAPVFVALRPDKTPRQCIRDEIIHDVKAEASGNAVHVQRNYDAQVVDLSQARKQKQERGKSSLSVDESLIEQLQSGPNKMVVDIDGHKLSVSNLDKVFWPAYSGHPGFTKLDYMLYLLRVSPWLLPHCNDRPVTFVRFPNGINKGKFYQKHWQRGLPEFAQTIRLYAQQAAADQEYVLCNNLATLLWLAQIADLELHTWQSRIACGPDGYKLPSKFTGSLDTLEASLLNYPDYLLFDLDPYLYSGNEKKGEEPQLHKAGFRMTVQAARWVKEILDSLKMQAFIKTTGKTGLHVYVPILREFTFDEVRAVSQTIAELVLTEHPDDVTMQWSVAKRTGKVFLDHNMNSRGKTLASIYSPRVSPEAAVSFPVSFDDLDKVYPTDFTMLNAPDVLKENGDPWADILQHKNDLRKLIEATVKPQPRRRSKHV